MLSPRVELCLEGVEVNLTLSGMSVTQAAGKAIEQPEQPHTAGGSSKMGCITISSALGCSAFFLAI